jgi:hypothetical protein
MNRTRLLIAVAIILVVAGVVLGVDFWQRSRAKEIEPGSIPIYVNGRLIGTFLPGDLEALEEVSFVDAEEGKTQEGWLLRDVLLLHVNRDPLRPDTTVVVTSSSRAKSAMLTWAQIDDEENYVMFDLSGRGTLKLVSRLEALDVRDEWVQDVDKIEITTP